MTGNIIGGWTFVYAAYAIVWTGFIGYSVSLLLRQRASKRAEPR